MSIKKYWDVARDGTGRWLGCLAAGESPWWMDEWETLVEYPREGTDECRVGADVCRRELHPPSSQTATLSLNLGVQRTRNLLVSTPCFLFVF